jgi:hypothetical protein
LKSYMVLNENQILTVPYVIFSSHTAALP